ncbi:aminotransferase-like domain-containing protein, partial [Streptomyces lavendulae]|uniref:aminotransferase-like domain-containing protein n=1 Tax=Streptomyces lavendulae TaxID=1914 RepID=UPI0036EFAF77
TVGFQEALFTTLRALFATEDDVLLVPEPCYTGVTGAAAVLGIRVVPVPEGPRGLDADDVARAAQAVRSAGGRPRACYVVPDFANPSGHRLTLTDRHRLLAVAHRHDLLLLEDNPYGFFTRDGRRRPTLRSLDARGHVVYLGSFAKSCFPGARVGYVVAGQPVHDAATGTSTPLAAELARVKSMITVNTPAVSQAVIGGMLLEHGCRLATANDRAARFYGHNMDLLLDGLATALPRAADQGVRWNDPDGGFFVRLEVPFIADRELLEISAERFGVIWTPMSSFHTGAGGRDALRLSISYLDPDQVREGVRRLARLITWRLDRPTGVPGHAAHAPRTGAAR